MIHAPLRLLFLVGMSLVWVACDSAGESERLIVRAYSGAPIMETDLRSEWHVEVDDQEVILRSRPVASDSLIFVVTFQESESALPELLDTWYGPSRGGLGEELRRVVVEIEEWDLGRKVSGLLRSELPTGGIVNERFLVEMEG